VSDRDWAAVAKQAIDANQYLTLATADAAGRPWASPVWYAHRDYAEFIWVSSPDARHSRNIAERPEVAIVIFDSTVPVGSASAVYVDALAEEVTGDDVERDIAVFSERSETNGARAWTSADVRPSARHRLYRARAVEKFVLDEGDQRISLDGGAV
jgi:nitroimidazol reductase NimA-like FMN-containing flavoprotein (pyridoxamine 5'-phosphate oxidase superfamily)